MKQPAQKDVSIIIPVLNSEATLEKCLSSIRANRTTYSYEIIVVDAGSRDRSLDIAQWYADRVYLGKRHTIDRNTGIKHATGNIICFTDSDCIVPVDWIEKLVGGLTALHNKDPKIQGVGGGNVPELENPTPVELAITRAMRSPFVSFRARNTAVYHEGREVTHNPPVNSACFKSVLEEVGGFVQEAGYPEDLDLDARIIARGYKLYYLPGVEVYHRHKNTLEAFARQMRDFGVKRCRVNRQHRHISRLYHYGPLVLCLMLHSPLFFVPLGMALANALLVSLKDGAFRLFFPVARLTIDFYRNYGFGEMKAVLGRIS
jgi:glycosyltransferase involved in cell wall biosynthesis